MTSWAVVLRWLCSSRRWVACVALTVAGAPSLAAAQNAVNESWALESRFGYHATDAAPLTAIRQILPLPDGRIVVTDVQDEGLLVYDADGVFERRIGGRGEGPGEFAYIGRAVAVGDTLQVVDSQLRRIVVFTISGAPIDAPIPIRREPVRERQDVALLRGHVLLAAIAPETTADLSLHFIGLGPAGAPTRTHAVRSIDWSQRRATLPIPLPNGKAVVHNPFSTGDVFAVAPDGGAVAWIEQPSPESEEAGAIRISMLSPTGSTVWTIDVPYRPRRLDRRLVEEWIEGLPNIEHLVAAGLVQKAAAVEMARDAYQAPEYLPAVSTRSGHAGGVLSEAAMVSTNGDVWVRLYEGPWLVVGPDRRVATVAVPDGVRLLAANANTVWGSVADEQGVPTIVRYRIRR